jgi:chromosome segregation ATPase
VNERAVHDLEELARRDRELADGADRLRALDGQVAAVRARAEAIDRFFAAYPEEERRRRAELHAAESELERRRAQYAEAQRELESARDAEAGERARHAVVRAEDHVSVATAARERAAASAAELERDASAFPEEVQRLEDRARAVATESGDVPPTPKGVRELVAWASHAHAELFVAIRQLEGERERLIREANELATNLLGEPTYGSTVAQLAERVVPLAGQ